ncbi:MAG: TonB-dependent receptor family protein [Bacteroidales bacterium]|nr:TonB-dependent receptor family protein [Bacteroidales bacterium]
MFLLTMVMLLSVFCVMAQPPGGGYPGGRPPGGYPGRPPMGGDRGGWNQQQPQQSPTVKPKKKVREGATFKVVGLLRDSVAGTPLAYANVAVLDAEDSMLIKGTSANSNGYFEIEGIPQGECILRVWTFNYTPRHIPFTVKNNTNLDVIRLMPISTTLGEVTIKGEKPIYAMDGEKLVYNVSEDASIQTGTTEDALQNAPGVEVDVEGNITLRGVSSVEIWINDKPSKLTEENLKTYLQTLPANALERIEAITNPSAKYATDAEAVINIVTSAHVKSNQFVSFGVNGSSQPFISPWVSYMWTKEKLSVNLFVSGRYSARRNASESSSYQRRDAAVAGEYDTTWSNINAQKDTNRSGSANFFLGINYEIDSTSEISFDCGGFYNNNNSRYAALRKQTYYYLDSMPPFSLDYIDTSFSKTLGWSVMSHAGIDYTKKFDNSGHNLRIGLNGRFSHNASDQWFNREYETYYDLNEHRYLLTRSYRYGADLDARYNRPYSEKGEMSYGLRTSHFQMSNDYKRYNDLEGTLIDTLRTYHFNGGSTNVNADVNWTHRWGGFTLSTGLGLGLLRDAYEYISDMPFADKGAPLFFSARPSIHLTYRTKNMHNIKLNYSMRMFHPGEEDLSQYRRYGDNSYSTGNPDGLKSGFTHSLEAGWQKYFNKFGNVGVEMYGRLSTNEISSLTDSEYDQYLDRVVSYSIPYNMGTSWRYGASLNATYRPTGFVNLRLYANVYDYGYKMEYDRDGVHQLDQRDKWSWSVRLNFWAKAFDWLQFTVAGNYTSPTLSLMSERKARYWLNFGLRSDLFKRKLSLFVNVQDIFNWGARFGSGSENTNPYYLSNNTNKMMNSRYISAGITLRFGKMELEKNVQEGDSATGDTL